MKQKILTIAVFAVAFAACESNGNYNKTTKSTEDSTEIYVQNDPKNDEVKAKPNEVDWDTPLKSYDKEGNVKEKWIYNPDGNITLHEIIDSGKTIFAEHNIYNEQGKLVSTKRNSKDNYEEQFAYTYNADGKLLSCDFQTNNPDVKNYTTKYEYKDTVLVKIAEQKSKNGEITAIQTQFIYDDNLGNDTLIQTLEQQITKDNITNKPNNSYYKWLSTWSGKYEKTGEKYQLVYSKHEYKINSEDEVINLETITLDYDEKGNLIKKTVDDSKKILTETRNYNAKNQLIKITLEQFDADTIKSLQIDEYEYDKNNRETKHSVKITTPDGKTNISNPKVTKYSYKNNYKVQNNGDKTFYKLK